MGVVCLCEKYIIIRSFGNVIHTPQKPFSALKTTQNSINYRCFFGVLVSLHSYIYMWIVIFFLLLFRFFLFFFFFFFRRNWVLFGKRQLKISRHLKFFFFFFFSFFGVTGSVRMRQLKISRH